MNTKKSKENSFLLKLLRFLSHFATRQHQLNMKNRQQWWRLRKNNSPLTRADLVGVPLKRVLQVYFRAIIIKNKSQKNRGKKNKKEKNLIVPELIFSCSRSETNEQQKIFVFNITTINYIRLVSDWHPECSWFKDSLICSFLKIGKYFVAF